MQIKSLFSLVATVAVVVSASTLPDALAQIANLETQITTLHGLVVAPVPQAMALHNSATNLLHTIDTTAVTIAAFEKPLPADACDTIISAYNPIIPTIQPGFQALTARRDIFKGLEAGRAGSVISLDLGYLRKGVIDIRDASLDVLPVDCDDRVNALALKFTNALDDAIRAYSN